MIGNSSYKPTWHTGLLLLPHPCQADKVDPLGRSEKLQSEIIPTLIFFPSNLPKFNENFRLLLQIEMSSNYPSAFHIIFNKSALLFQLSTRKQWKTSHFLGPLHPFKRALLKCLKTSLPLEHLCGEKKERVWNGLTCCCLWFIKSGTHTSIKAQTKQPGSYRFIWYWAFSGFFWSSSATYEKFILLCLREQPYK